MKIDNAVKSVGGLPNNESNTRSVRGQPGSTGSSIQAELSSPSSNLQQLESAIASVPVVDSAHVAEIKQAISDGRFQVHSEKVADSLIESVRQILAAQIPH